MTVVVCGASGFVGSLVVDRLVRDGVDVRAGTRDPAKGAKQRPDLSWVELDVEKPKTLAAAFAGASAVIYLVHQMREDSDDLEALERASASNVLQAAEQAGVARMVYLGAPIPKGEISSHIKARLATGECLRSGEVSTIELRAGMVIGKGSESWLMVRDLALRLPIMVLPRWLKNRSEPVAIDDVVDGIIAAVSLPGTESRVFGIPGPEALSGTEILIRIASQVGMRPLMIPVPFLTPRLSSHWVRVISRADYSIAKKLVDGLTSDILCTDPTLWQLTGHCPMSFDEAVRRALADEDRSDLDAWGRTLERLARRVALRP